MTELIKIEQNIYVGMGEGEIKVAQVTLEYSPVFLKDMTMDDLLQNVSRIIGDIVATDLNASMKKQN